MAKAVKRAASASPMDYAEHDRTYNAFLWVTKWTVAGCLALLIAMAIGFFGGFGLIGGTLVLVLLLAVCYFTI